MNPYLNEDVMWQRLKDVQMEAENRRLYGGRLPGALDLIGIFAKRAWLLAGLAMRRPPRHRPVEVLDGGREAANDAA
jgi:hypothetical protein